MKNGPCSYCHDTGYHNGVRVRGECNYCTSAERRERQRAYLATLDQAIPPIQWRIVASDDKWQGIAWPDGYGVAWRDYSRCCTILMPIPLNVICGAVRAAYHWMRRGFGGSILDQRIHDAQRAGFNHGSDSGYRLGYDVGKQEGLKQGWDNAFKRLGELDRQMRALR